MKKQVLVFCLLVAGLLPLSCNNKPTAEMVVDPDAKASVEPQQSKTKPDKKATTKTIKMTKEDFQTKVFNYEEDDSEWKYLGDKPAIIDFYADWCGPCRRIAPILEELAAEYEGEIYIYKVDVDKEKELASVFGIRSVPCILFIPMEGGPQIAQGALPKDVFKEAIKEVLLVE
jgi:thioredoxin